VIYTSVPELNPLSATEFALSNFDANASVGAGVLLPRGLSFMQAQGANSRRLDFHHHFGSPAWVQMTRDRQSQGWQTWQPNADELRGVDRENGLRILPKYRV
jgi:hypothetical protein